MRKVKLNDATQPELLDYCVTVLGIPDLDPNTNLIRLQQKVLDLQPELNEIVVSDSVMPQEAKEPPVATRPGHGGGINRTERASIAKGDVTATNGHNDPKVRINIFKDDQNKGEPIPVSVNGRTMLIPVGTTVPIPLRYFLALKEAITTVYDFDAKTNENIPRVESRHRFNVVGMPSESEVVAWDRKLGGDGVMILEKLAA